MNDTTMNDRRPTPETAAATEYAERANEARRLLDRIRIAIDADSALVANRRREIGRDIDWADAGSMAEVARKLGEVAEFLGAK